MAEKQREESESNGVEEVGEPEGKELGGGGDCHARQKGGGGDEQEGVDGVVGKLREGPEEGEGTSREMQGRHGNSGEGGGKLNRKES